MNIIFKALAVLPNLLLEKVYQFTFHQQCVSSQSHRHLAFKYSFSYHKYFVAFNEYRKISTEYLNGCVSWPQSDPEILLSQRLGERVRWIGLTLIIRLLELTLQGGQIFHVSLKSVHRAVIPQLCTETFR